MNPTSHAQKGFTLIELIMVIVILGILSAFALPKFADLSGSASKATVQGALGAVKSGAAIAHAQWLANGSTGDITLENLPVVMVLGYPAQDSLGNLADLSEFSSTDATTAGYVIISSGKTTGDPCFAYTESAVADSPPTISAVLTYTSGATDAVATCAP